jgi:glycosyltransferase involved in cell wall biosynthesis
VRILGFGTYDRTRHPRSGVLLDGLRLLGHDVRELNRPIGFSTAERVDMVRHPWRGYRFALRLGRRWSELAVGRLRLRFRPDAVLVGYLGQLDVVLARLLFPRTRIVLDLLIFAADTAVDRGISSGPKDRLLGLLDDIAIRCASVIVVDTDEHLALIDARHRHKALVVPVGASAEWFGDDDRSAADEGPLSVVFFGLFTPLQGAPVIGDALRQLADPGSVRVTMIGSGQDRDETRRRAGDLVDIDWHEWVESADLPAVVREHDVCLGIFGTTPKALRVVPNKVYQGAAAGCVIVTSDTAPQRHMLGDAAVFVLPGDPAALAAALSRLAADSAERRRLRAAAHERAEQRFHPRSVAMPLDQALRSR